MYKLQHNTRKEGTKRGSEETGEKEGQKETCNMSKKIIK